MGPHFTDVSSHGVPQWPHVDSVFAQLGELDRLPGGLVGSRLPADHKCPGPTAEGQQMEKK